MERNKRLLKNDAMRRIFRPTQISDDVINGFSDRIECRLKKISLSIQKSNHKRITLEELIIRFGFAIDTVEITTKDFE
jgi:hypothetical protein